MTKEHPTNTHTKTTGVPYLMPFATVFQDAGGVIDGTVVLADGEVGAFMLIHLDHQVVVLQL